jgi:hypothetical protein
LNDLKQPIMIIVVRINRCRTAGGSVAACAYRAWRLSTLLHNTAFRNRFRFLVALNGPNVEGVFCINGVAPDVLPGKVQFDLDPVNDECFLSIQNAIGAIYESANLKYLQGSRYITEEHFLQAGVEVPMVDCCPLRNIPVIEGLQIQNLERPL